MQIDQQELLEKALIGFSHQKQQLDEKMAAIRAQLGETKPAAAEPKRRVMSVAARKRIAAAQKKRWAEYHQQKAAAA